MTFGQAKGRRKGNMKTKMRKGATFLEYALLAALVGIVAAAGLSRYGAKLLDLFNALADKTAEVTTGVKK